MELLGEVRRGRSNSHLHMLTHIHHTPPTHTHTSLPHIHTHTPPTPLLPHTPYPHSSHTHHIHTHTPPLHTHLTHTHPHTPPTHIHTSSHPSHTVLLPQVWYGLPFPPVPWGHLSRHTPRRWDHRWVDTAQHVHNFGLEYCEFLPLHSAFSSLSPPSLPPPPPTDYAVHIFHEAVKYGRYTCFLHEDTRLPMIYLPDCVKATIMYLEAPASCIRDDMRYYHVTSCFTLP